MSSVDEKATAGLVRTLKKLNVISFRQMVAIAFKAMPPEEIRKPGII